MFLYFFFLFESLLNDKKTIDNTSNVYTKAAVTLTYILKMYILLYLFKVIVKTLQTELH